MLILAGVTINLTLGENGIFTTAQKAAKNYTEAQNKELKEVEKFTNTVNNIIEGKLLTNQITGADYGKYINYSVTVKETVLDKWRVFYNDTTNGNVYIILDGYLPNELIPEETGIKTTGKYQAYWENSTLIYPYNKSAVETLLDKEKWKVFTEGVEGATAMGGPTNEMLVKSWNSNPVVNATLLTADITSDRLKDASKLYIPYTNVVESCTGYWLASFAKNNDYAIWFLSNSGHLHDNIYGHNGYGIRPVICLPYDIAGTVGDSVVINK